MNNQIVIAPSQIEEFARGEHNEYIGNMIGGAAVGYGPTIAQFVQQNEALHQGFAIEYRLEVQVKTIHEVPTVSSLPMLPKKAEAEEAAPRQRPRQRSAAE
ncbi:MAG: hypothetical protein V4807_12150 [Burkholderia gladioli]|uniref:hypothetical protein n=1 Tax=Burkholderia gladioli TaxID=28095 RepID=UPI002855B5C7|nr:hypothetical protein [Burkholderia gladioli]MDR8091111.1 hypothetical protein [Burkholderia gladioli]